MSLPHPSLYSIMPKNEMGVPSCELDRCIIRMAIPLIENGVGKGGCHDNGE